MSALLAAAVGLLLAAKPGAPPPLDGNWTFGAGTPEPAERTVVIPHPCWEPSVTMFVQQRGADVLAEISWNSTPRRSSPSHVLEGEHLTGKLEGDHLVLTGEHRRTTMGPRGPELPGDAETHLPVRYDLRYQPKSGHLVGTRNGQPFWAAHMRYKLRKCGPQPP